MIKLGFLLLNCEEYDAFNSRKLYHIYLLNYNTLKGFLTTITLRYNSYIFFTVYLKDMINYY